ncbi:MAG: homoserine kinase [Caulobacteraceae bacterium]
MAVYTDITDSDLEAFLADFDLGQAQSCKGIAEGVENSNFLVETTAGRFILTIYERRVREEDLPFFLGLMQWLAQHGYPCAEPMPGRDGRIYRPLRGKPAALVEFMNGISVRRPTAQHCREAGEGMAWLHECTRGFPLRRVNDLGQAAWRPLFERLRGAADGLKPGLADVVDRDLTTLAGCWPAELPAGAIHADLFPDNVFFQGGRFAAAIDFYFACDDFLAYDVAVALNAWCFEPDGSFNATLAQAFLAGYERRRPLSPAERRALPVLAWGAAMRFFLTRLNDWGATPEGALVRPKDPLEYERKLAVHRAGLHLYPEPA